MTTKFKSGQWISKEDVLKLGEVRWDKFRDKYKSEHVTTMDFTRCGLFENHCKAYSCTVKAYSDGDLAWDEFTGKEDNQINLRNHP